MRRLPLMSTLATADNRARGTSSSRIDRVTSASSSRVKVESAMSRDGEASRSRKRASSAARRSFLRRPSERFQKHGGIENIPPWPLRPLVLDEPDDRHVVEVAVSCRLVVEEMHAVCSVWNLKGLFADPAPDGRRQIVNRPRRVVMPLTRRRDTVKDFEQRVAAEPFACGEFAVRFKRSKVTLQEVDQPTQLFGRGT